MSFEEDVDLVKQILENLRNPEQLNEHPWAKGNIAREAISEADSRESKNLGAGLVAGTVKLFKELMPGTHPRRGKRLDTRWGEFGILAAQYFGPFLLGAPSPVSLREAWGEIDRAILFFVYGKPAAELAEDEIARYKLIGDESEIAAYSTISDWHLNGLKRLTRLMQEREEHLAKKADQGSDPSVENQPGVLSSQKRVAPPSIWIKILTRVLIVCLLLVSLLGINKAWKVYKLSEEVRADLNTLQVLAAPTSDLKALTGATEKIAKLRKDIGDLRDEAEPTLQTLGPWLAWVPVYGADIASSGDLLSMADELAGAGQAGYLAMAPILDVMQNSSGSVRLPSITSLLLNAQPQLTEAQKRLDLAVLLRSKIVAENLSPRTQVILKRIDPLVGQLSDGLILASAIPSLLGAGSDGPKTYMILAQNEDELRPTGGYLTSVGSLVVESGDLLDLQFQDSAIFQDWSKPYPSAPQPMRDYMDIPVMLLRDANWFVDYPTTVMRVEYLYAYQNKHSVDGVFAIDQQALVILLKVLGSVRVDGTSQLITSDNVIQFMRESKIPPPIDSRPEGWSRKTFISKLASAMLARLLSGENLNWQQIALALQVALNEKHILLQIDEPNMKELIGKHAWDGAVHAGSGDFLMSVDANVGYNKTNAVVDKKLTYDIDLQDIARPIGSLSVFHENRASIDSPCRVAILDRPNRNVLEDYYAINRCYYNYMRIYVPAGTVLLDATPHAVPAEWMMLNKPVPAQVDVLDEKVSGLQAFGTLLVVPGAQSLSTSFQFALPVGVIAGGTGNEKTYSLKIQKQPGTLAIPITIRIHLPVSARIVAMSAGAIATANDILIESRLTTDLNISVVFSVP